jgi:hypothetical protein
MRNGGSDIRRYDSATSSRGNTRVSKSSEKANADELGAASLVKCSISKLIHETQYRALPLSIECMSQYIALIQYHIFLNIRDVHLVYCESHSTCPPSIFSCALHRSVGHLKLIVHSQRKDAAHFRGPQR